MKLLKGSLALAAVLSAVGYQRAEGQTAASTEANSRTVVYTYANLADSRAANVGSTLVLPNTITAYNNSSASGIAALSSSGTTVVRPDNLRAVTFFSFTPNDPLYATHQRSYLQQIGAPLGWAIAQTSTVPVAVVDSGVSSHSEFGTRLLPGYDYSDNDNNPEDLLGHGTAVAGTFSAGLNNGVGIAGLSQSPFFALRVATAQGAVSLGALEAAVNALRQTTTVNTVVNMSLGGAMSRATSLTSADNPFRMVHALMAPENNSKLLYVAAAGNGRPSDPNNLSSTPRGFNIDTDPQTVYPAAFTHGNLITVGALNSAGSGPASFSNFGSRSVDIFAPGELIASTGPADGYTSNDGTSFASPLVAGAASLLWSRHPSLKSAAVKCAIMASATRIPSLTNLAASGGILNLPVLLSQPTVPAAIHYVLDTYYASSGKDVPPGASCESFISSNDNRFLWITVRESPTRTVTFTFDTTASTSRPAVLEIRSFNPQGALQMVHQTFYRPASTRTNYQVHNTNFAGAPNRFTTTTHYDNDSENLVSYINYEKFDAQGAKTLVNNRWFAKFNGTHFEARYQIYTILGTAITYGREELKNVSGFVYKVSTTHYHPGTSQIKIFVQESRDPVTAQVTSASFTEKFLNQVDKFHRVSWYWPGTATLKNQLIQLSTILGDRYYDCTTDYNSQGTAVNWRGDCTP